TRSVVRVKRSWTNTSSRPLVSPGTRLVAAETKTTKWPSALIAGWWIVSFASFPAPSTLTRSVMEVRRSCTNTSPNPLVSPGARFLAHAAKATKRPSGVIDGGGAKAPERQGPFAWFPALSTLTRSVVPGKARAGGAGVEGDETAIGADRGTEAALAVCLVAAAVHAHPLGGAGRCAGRWRQERQRCRENADCCAHA